MDTALAEPVWHGMLTCDYELTRPHATLLEWDLYTTSLINWPTTLMADPTPYGRLRRAGIVDIPEADHHRLLARWHTALADPDYITDLAQKTATWTSRLATTLTTLQRHRKPDEAVRAALAEATRDLLALNATHIVNWLLPEQRWEQQLTDLLGTTEKARACLLAFSTPTEPGHLLHAHTRLLSAAAHVHHGGDLRQEAETFATHTGPVYSDASPGRTALPLEDPTTVAAQLTTTTPDSAHAHHTAIADARASALALQDAWHTAAVLAAADDALALRAVQAIALACRWATDCEERRKELRHRYLAAVRRWCTHTHHDPDHITTHDLLTGAARGAVLGRGDHAGADAGGAGLPGCVAVASVEGTP